jgi:hypothetical protein
MVSCFLATCPQSHRRPRDLVRRHWSHLVSEATPLWTVLVDDRPAIVAPADDRLVVVCGGLRAVDWTIQFGQVTEASSARSVVYVVDDDGHCYDFTFLESGDALRAAQLIDQRRATARGAAQETGERTVARWEGWRAMEPMGQGDPEQVDTAPAPEVEPTAGEDYPTTPVVENGRTDMDDAEQAETADVVTPEPVAATAPAESAEPPAAEDAPAPTEDAAEQAPDVEEEREAALNGVPQPAAGQVLGDVAEPADEPLDVESPDGGFTELPIEHEVAMAIARSGGEPIDWWSIPPRGSIPIPKEQQPLPIPAQASAPVSESVLLVTTEVVPGREVLEVHGDVLAVASWPPPGPSGRSVHEVARERLALAVLRRGGNALVGMRYGATGMVGGDVVAYGTAVTLSPVPAEAAAGADPPRAAERG